MHPPQKGYAFVKWAGDGNDTQLLNGPTSAINILRVEGPLNLQAVFAIREYEITITKTGEGNFTGEGNYTWNDPINLTAQPSQGWSFQGWEGNISYLSSTGQNTSINKPDSGPLKQSLSFNAVFEQASHQIITQANQGGNISLKIGEGEWIVSEEHNQSIASLLLATLEANASQGYEFVGWHNLPEVQDLYDGFEHSLNSDENLIYFVPKQDLNISASFDLIDYNSSQVSISSTSGGTFSVQNEENGGYLHFQEYELNASAAEGYTFVKWAGDGNDTQLLNGPTSAINILRVEGPLNLQAVFAIREYEITITKTGEGNFTGEGNYTWNDPINLTAQPSQGWSFQGWEGNISYLSSTGQNTSINKPDSGPLKQSLSFNAVFEQASHQIITQANQGGQYIVKNWGGGMDRFRGTQSIDCFFAFGNPGSQCVSRDMSS